MQLSLKKAAMDDGMDIYQFLQQLPTEENGFVNSAAGKSYEEFRQWLRGTVTNSQQTGIVDGWKVPQSTYWLYLDGRPIGYGKIRHFLTEKLKETGGHLGISIHPQYRGRGYGTAFIGLLVEESRKLGIDEILFTIRNENCASIKATLASGAVLQKVTDRRHYLIIRT